MPIGIIFLTKQSLKLIYMSDDPNKKGADAKRISQQDHEQAYQKRKAKSESKTDSQKASGRGNNSGDKTGKRSER